MASICPSTSMSVVSMYKDGLVESTHLGENSAGLAIAAFTAARELESSMSRPLASSTMKLYLHFPGSFYEENSSQYNNCCNDQDPFCKKKFSEEIFLLQLLFSFPYFSFHNSESFPVHLAKIIQGMTGKFKMLTAVLEIQFSDWEKGAIFFLTVYGLAC